MIRYATRLPPNSATALLPNGLVRKTEYFSTEQSFKFIVAVVEHFIKSPDPMVVPVYDYAILSERRHDYSICYDMMQCGILEEDERKLVDYIGDLWDVHGTDTWNRIDAGTCRRYAEELPLLQEQNPLLSNFLKRVVTEGRYLDLHSGNVMRNEDNEFVLIDLEGFIRTPLEAEINSWITR